MLDLNLIEKDFYFDVENKTIKGTQGTILADYIHYMNYTHIHIMFLIERIC